jgi:hypothetical protein
MPSPPEDLTERLIALERDIDAGLYRGGRWQALLADLRRLPGSERAAVAATVSRVSDKLHARKAQRKVAFPVGLALEIGLALLGAGLLWFAVANRSSWAGIMAALAWTTAFQPLIKVLTGTALGIRYSYAYLIGPEPRFKMRYGTYIAAARPARIVLHLSGAVGSPLGAWLPVPFLAGALPAVSGFCRLLFGLVVAVNAIAFVLALAGFKRIGPLRLSLTSAASAALEMREALRVVR